MVPKPRPGVRYTAQQMEQMRQAYPDFRMPGFVLRIDADGMSSFVPWHQAAGGGALDPNRPEEDLPMRALRATWDEDPFPVDPIRKRTPQQRTESMMDNLVADWKRTGTIPGLSDEKVKELVGRSWKQGRPLTAAQVRAAAAALLQEAENRYEAAERKKVVRTAPSD